MTLIADNYFGYCKKRGQDPDLVCRQPVRQCGRGARRRGVGLPAAYNLANDFDAGDYRTNDLSLADLARQDPETIDLRSEGYGVDVQCPNLVYVPHDARADLSRLQMWWTQDGREQSVPLRPGKTYMTPSGYKVQLEKHPSTGTWRLIGTVAEGLFCHKPCTVSGGGKSEISKRLDDYILYGSIFVADLEKDFDLVQRLIDRDYTDRWKPGRGPNYSLRPSRPLLSPLRSLGSTIKLLTPTDDYTPDYNAWLASFPDHIYPLVYLIKRYIPPQAQGNWRELFGVDSINGRPGHELKGLGRRLVGGYLRVGLLSSQGWRTFKLRQDFAPAVKVQMEDDITASVVIPADQLRHLPPGAQADSYKFAVNCEYRLFQRPDDAVHRGLDRQTEADMARFDNFLSNFEPLTAERAQTLVDRVTEFDEFSPPMREVALSGGRSRVGGRRLFRLPATRQRPTE